MNKHDDIQILIGSKGSRESELSTEKKLYNGDTKCRNQFLFMWCIFSVIVLYAADIHFIGHKFIWEKSASLMPSQTVVPDYVFTWNNETLKLIFDWYFNSWGYIPSIFDHLPCFYKHFKHWLCDTRLYIEDKEKNQCLTLLSLLAFHTMNLHPNSH